MNYLFTVKNLAIVLGAATITIILYFYINNLKNTIKDYEIKISEVKLESINFKRQSELLKTSLNQQNKVVNNLKTDYKKSIITLKEWKSKPKEIRYEVIYKTIYKNKVTKSNECEDIKIMLDNIATLNYNSL